MQNVGLYYVLDCGWNDYRDIHDINRIALEKCLDVGGYLLVQALVSLVGGPGNMKGGGSIRLAEARILL